MSGGVDSSVAAAVLKEDGYEVIGLTMKLWDYEDVGGKVDEESSCCSVDSINNARQVCDEIGIPHYTVNFTDIFKKEIIRNFVGEYLKGRTPNPCVLCNVKIKWEALLRKGLEIGADYFSTGHYAQVEFEKDRKRYLLKKGRDKGKDQSYALWGLSQEALSKTILPVGKMSKSEVREFAEKRNLKTAQVKESQEICFIPDDDYHRFLHDWDSGVEIREGEIIDKDGRVLGYHKGYPFYTIGQRKKLGIAVGRPIYVTRIEPETNRIYVGDEEDLYDIGFTAENVNMIAFDKLEKPVKALTKIRYNDDGAESTVLQTNDAEVKIIFDSPKKSITPGQSAVFYQDDAVIGGGVIKERIPAQPEFH